MNSVSLIGRTTKEVELRRTGEGKAVAHFTLAVNRDYKNEQGEYDADFINCVAFGKQGETIGKYVHKGDKFAVVGKLKTGSYEADGGKKVYYTDVIVEKFDFIESKKQTENAENISSDFGVIDDDDATLPF